MLKHTTTVFVIGFLLILSLTQSSSREVPSEPKTAERKVADDANIPEPMDERCEGVGDEECLMRRTLAAQVDYIYTQGKKP